MCQWSRGGVRVWKIRGCRKQWMEEVVLASRKPVFNIKSLTSSGKCFCVFPMQCTRVQDQLASLKSSNENLQKQTEDLISKLKEVSHRSLSVSQLMQHID